MARNKTVFAALAALLLGAAMLSLCVGAVPVSPGEILSALLCGERETVGARIVLYTRLPRTAAALRGVISFFELSKVPSISTAIS